MLGASGVKFSTLRLSFSCSCVIMVRSMFSSSFSLSFLALFLSLEVMLSFMGDFFITIIFLPSRRSGKSVDLSSKSSCVGVLT